MRIIALQGKHSCGKTATLKQLIEIMHKDNFIYEGVYPKGDILKLCRKRKGDVQYWCSFDGIKIGITTRGDARRYLHTDFYTKRRRNFSDRDVVVCAIRTYGGTVEFVDEHDPNRIIIPKEIVLDKDDKTQQETVNTTQAAMILKKILEFKEEFEVQK